MNTSKPEQNLDKLRVVIAKRVRELRVGRHWTQAELSKRLRSSQARLSEIERGDGSFTAEQFLTILKLFNVAPSHFAPNPQDDELELQNALARFGALHLQESENVLPSSRFNTVGDLVRETLVSTESPRLLAALAPVLVRNVDTLNLERLQLQLAQIGRDRRFAWLIENTLEAVGRELRQAPPRAWAKIYRRAEVVLGAFLDSVKAGGVKLSDFGPDILDANIRSKQTVIDVLASSSKISRDWGVVASLQPDDFAAALRAARVQS